MPQNYFNSLIYPQLDKAIAELTLVRKLSHSGEKGREAEGILRSFLRQILPKEFGVYTGFAASDRRISTQLDVVLADHQHYPILYSGYEISVLPIESVRSSIEVTMDLQLAKIEDAQHKANQLKEILQNSIDALQHFGDEMQPLRDNLITVLFAYESDAAFDTIIDRLNNSNTKGLDLVFVVNRGFAIRYQSEEGDRYSRIPVETITWTGVQHDGYVVTQKHKRFAMFLGHYFDRLAKWQRASVNYMGLYSRSSIGEDFVIEDE